MNYSWLRVAGYLAWSIAATYAAPALATVSATTPNTDSTLFSFPGLYPPSGYFLALTLGQTHSSGAHSENITLTTIDGHPIKGNFTDSTPSAGTDYGVEGGVVAPVTSAFELLWGIGLFHSSGTTVTGDYYFNGDSDPDSHYQYSLSNTRLVGAVTGHYTFLSFAPAFSVLARLGVGYAQLQADGVSVTPLTVVDAPVLTGQNANQWVYEYGIGAEYAATAHWSTGLHYDWLHLGTASLQTTKGKTLSMDSADSTRLSLQLRYRF